MNENFSSLYPKNVFESTAVHAQPSSDGVFLHTSAEPVEVQPCMNNTEIRQITENYQSFISKFSHEVRNPLTLICSSLQLLEKDHPELSDDTLWTQIQQDIQATLRLLKDVSSLNSQKSVHKAQLSVSRFLNSVAASVAPLMRSSDISFTVSYSPLLASSMLFGDEIRLREALTNLLVNAVEAVNTSRTSAQAPSDRTSAQAPSDRTSAQAPSEIVLSADKTGSNVSIHVRDNGPGIPNEYLETLFDPFVTHKPNGTGLGLNIVRTIAQQHNGSVSVTTRTHPSHSYTDFCLCIPLEASCPAAATYEFRIAPPAVRSACG